MMVGDDGLAPRNRSRRSTTTTANKQDAVVQPWPGYVVACHVPRLQIEPAPVAFDPLLRAARDLSHGEWVVSSYTDLCAAREHVLAGPVGRSSAVISQASL